MAPMSATLLLPVGALLLNLYALVLVLLRVPVFRTRLYRPILLNIGLSLAPAGVLALVLVLLLAVVVWTESAVALWAVAVGGGVVWLLLLPNSAYLITELNLSHRRQDDPVPLWYDIVLVLTLALSGVINTLLNVVIAQTIYVAIAYPNAAHPFATPDSWALAAAVLVLVTVGMYLGRYLRFNSWDVRHPASFLRKLRDHLAVRANRRAAAGFCATHTVMLLIFYLVVVTPVLVVL